jgi:serine protease inhibitor
VDEEGTSGAALTSVTLNGAAFPKDVHELYANKPFVFIIEDRRDTCLFLGKVENIK